MLYHNCATLCALFVFQFSNIPFTSMLLAVFRVCMPCRCSTSWAMAPNCWDKIDCNQSLIQCGYCSSLHKSDLIISNQANSSMRAPNRNQELIFIFSIAKYWLSISSQKLAKAASEKISRIFQLISKGGFVFLDFKFVFINWIKFSIRKEFNGFL